MIYTINLRNTLQTTLTIWSRVWAFGQATIQTNSMESGSLSYPMSELSFPMEQFIMDLSLCLMIVSRFFWIDVYFDTALPTATIATHRRCSCFLHFCNCQ
jgi:hypothetical protein